jgi:hypothetical protein
MGNREGINRILLFYSDRKYDSIGKIETSKIIFIRDRDFDEDFAITDDERGATPTMAAAASLFKEPFRVRVVAGSIDQSTRSDKRTLGR